MRLTKLTRIAIFGPLALVSAFGQSIDAGGIVNSVTFGKGQAVSQGSLVAVFGSQLAAATAVAASIPLATTLGDVSVTFDGVAAPITFVSASQINVQVPWEVLGGAAGTSNVVVKNGGNSSAPQPVQLGPASPGIYATVDGHAIAVDAQDPNSDRYGKITAPRGSIPGLTTLPANVGDLLIVYATGLGPVNPAPLTGSNSMDTTRFTTVQPVVMIGGVPANVAFAGLSPQFVGVYQLNVFVPQVPVGNAVPIQIQLGGQTSPVTTNIAIE
ncbi:MAG TPA: IPT/TIG domain-containing protein [Bryobacteraceae bacterium]|nr:IPT/TIG domain-containing protein [Bryobacteraceae bacterium]